MKRPVHVIVVAYHAVELLAQAIGALEGTFAVTVVDNSSDDAVRLASLEAGARYVDPGRNLGFGAGANVALLDLLEGEPCDVLLLNPDALISPDSVKRLSQALHAPGGPRGAVSPRIWDSHGVEQRVLWPWPTPGRAVLAALGLGSFRERNAYLIGAVLCVNWDALNEVGLFDERFFLYAEETDWQHRAARIGWPSELVSDVAATHVGAGTSTDIRRRTALFLAGGETYIRKWHGVVGWQVYRFSSLAGAVLRAVVLRGRRRREARLHAAILAAGPRRAARVQ
jgi:GT2 family glycosyltransferase